MIFVIYLLIVFIAKPIRAGQGLIGVGIRGGGGQTPAVGAVKE